MSGPSSTKDILKLQENASMFRMAGAVLVTLSSSAGIGAALGFSTIAAIAYTSHNGTHPEDLPLETPLNQEEMSWLVSMMHISIMISLLVSGFMAEILGPKRTILVGQTCILLGWIVVYLATNFISLLIGRFIMGLGAGLSLSSTTLQLSEIALIRYRGIFSMMNNLTVYAALIYSLVLSATVSLNMVMILSAIPTVAFLVASFFLPESPIWLVKKGQLQKAKLSIIVLRGMEYDYMPEMKELEHLTQNQGNVTFPERIRELRSRKNVVPFLIMALMISLQPLSGSEMVTYYSLKVFRQANVSIDKHILSLLVPSGVVIGFLISSVLLSKIKRKLHFSLATILMAVSLTALGFSLQTNDLGLHKISMMALPTSVICTALAYGLGVAPVLFAHLGEILPLSIKSWAIAIIMAMRYLVSFINLKLFPALVLEIGLPGMFWIHAIICIILCVLGILLLPETQGKTLTELSELYTNSKEKKLKTNYLNSVVISSNANFSKVEKRID